jgi:Ca2+-binding EF-hand superfamily protein
MGVEATVGQKLVLKGSSARWAGEGKQVSTYQATVVDIRSSDDTIKVQYADGGYKRFARKDFAASVVDRPSGPSTEEAQRTCRTVVEGDRLFVKGTGRWTDKGYYRAEVIECRESDDTVKIRFMDGAMKRWSRRELMGLVEEHENSSGDTGTVFESLTDTEIKRAFEHADRDGDGVITVPELRASMRELGQSCSPKMAKDLITSAAGEGAPGIDRAGFLKLVRDREGTCRALYDLLKDKGQTDLVLSKVGEEHIGSHLTALLGNDFNVAQFVKLLEGMDRDSDGQVSFKEFQEALLFSSVLDGKRGVYGLAEVGYGCTIATPRELF